MAEKSIEKLLAESSTKDSMENQVGLPSGEAEEGDEVKYDDIAKDKLDMDLAKVTNGADITSENNNWSEVTDDDGNKPDDNADVTGDNESATVASLVGNNANGLDDITSAGANIEVSVTAIEAATDDPTVNTLVKRDASGVSSFVQTSVKDAVTGGALNIKYEKQVVEPVRVDTIYCNFAKLVEGVRLLGCQICPKNVITKPNLDTYDAAYKTGNVQVICTNIGLGTQVKVSFNDNAASSKTSDATDIVISTNGANDFDSGSFTIIVYYIDFSTMS